MRVEVEWIWNGFGIEWNGRRDALSEVEVEKKKQKPLSEGGVECNEKRAVESEVEVELIVERDF